MAVAVGDVNGQRNGTEREPHGVIDRTEASHRALVAIRHVVQKQAYILAFSDTFYLLGVALIVALIASMLLKKPDHLDAGGAH